MLWFVLMGLLGVTLIVSFLVAFDKSARFPAVAAGVFAGIAIVGVTVGMSFAQVNAGNIGVVKAFGECNGTMQPGIHGKAPWESVDEVDTKTQKLVVEMDLEQGSAVSSETQPVFATVVVNYRLEPEQVPALVCSDVGLDFESKVIEPRVRQVFKAETVQYKTVDVAPAREQIRTNVQVTLDGQLEDFGIIVQDTLIENLGFAPEFLQAIEDKQVATQNALEAQERVQQAVHEAEQKVKAAEGEARALEEKARAIRENPEVLQLEYIQKLNPNVEVIYLPNDAAPLIQLPAPTQEKAE